MTAHPRPVPCPRRATHALCSALLLLLLTGCPTFPEKPSLGPSYDSSEADAADSVDGTELWDDQSDQDEPHCLSWDRRFVGSLQLRTLEQLEPFADCQEIDGSVTIEGDELEVLNLPFRTVSGVLWVRSTTQLRSLSVTATTLGGLRLTENSVLQQLDLPYLQQVGELSLKHNDQLAALDALALGELGAMEVEANGQLTRISLGAYQAESITLGGCSLQPPDYRCIPSTEQSNAALVQLQLPRLQSAQTLALLGQSLTHLEAASLTDVSNITIIASLDGSVLALPSLQRANFLRFEDTALTGLELPLLAQLSLLWIGATSQLETLHLPALTVLEQLELDGAAKLSLLSLERVHTLGSLSMSNNAQLSAWDWTSLTVVSTRLSVRDNPSLPQCLVLALVAQLGEGLTGELESSGNDELATCD